MGGNHVPTFTFRFPKKDLDSFRVYIAKVLLLLLLLIVSQVARSMHLMVVISNQLTKFPIEEKSIEAQASMATDLSPLSDSVLE